MKIQNTQPHLVVQAIGGQPLFELFCFEKGAVKPLYLAIIGDVKRCTITASAFGFSAK